MADFAPRAVDASAVHATVIVAIETGTRNIFYCVNGRMGADDLLPAESVIRSARVLFLDHYGMVGNLRAASIARDQLVTPLASRTAGRPSSERASQRARRDEEGIGG